ncbi:MAG: RagB/SusD family nutrient uptake outer membrane protein [Niabella sp.]
MKKVFNILFVIIIAIAYCCTGCNKLLDIEPSNTINEKNAWKTIVDARSALLGNYGLLRSALAENEANWMYGEFRNSAFKSVSRADLKAVIDGQLDLPFALLEDLSNWRKFYAVINSSFLFIEKSGNVLDTDPQYTGLTHDVDVAQMKALIALTYYYLVRTWGDVPLIRQSYDGQFPAIPRSSASAVLTYAEQLLKEAAPILPYVYGSVSANYFSGLYYGSSDWSGDLINRLTAYVLLAHVAVLDGRYLDASAYLDYATANSSAANLFTSTTSVLVSTTSGVFTNTNNKHVLAFGMSQEKNETTPTGHIENLVLGYPLIPRVKPLVYIPSEDIATIYNEPNDERFNIDLSGNNSSMFFSNLNSEYPLFSKISIVGPTSSTSTSNPSAFTVYGSPIVFSRAEEIILLQAETKAVLGDTSLALDLLNLLRANRKLSKLPGGANVIGEIFKERRKELIGEAWYWFDLVREKKIKRDDPVFNEMIATGGIYWPVAQEVLDANKSIQQTPFWKK